MRNFFSVLTAPLFVIHYLESIVVKLAACKKSVLYLAYVVEQTGLFLIWSKIPKTRPNNVRCDDTAYSEHGTNMPLE